MENIREMKETMKETLKSKIDSDYPVVLLGGNQVLSQLALTYHLMKITILLT